MAKQRQKKSGKSTSTARPLSRRKHSREQASGGVGNMLRQYQLRVAPANDQYESEADEMARRVAAIPEHRADQQEAGIAEQVTPLVQRRETPDEEKEIQAKRIQRQTESEEAEEIQSRRIQRQAENEEEEEIQARRIQRQAENEEEEELQARRIQRQELEAGEEDLQTRSARPDREGRLSPQMEERIQQLMQGGGRPLDKETRDYFEPRFGADFGQIRVHDDAEAARIAGQMNSRAFTQGRHIFFGQGQYQPQTSAGRDLLAHELTHTLQQGAAATTGRQRQQPIQRDVIQRANGENGGGSSGSSSDVIAASSDGSLEVSSDPLPGRRLPRIHMAALSLPAFKYDEYLLSKYQPANQGNRLYRDHRYQSASRPRDASGKWDGAMTPGSQPSTPANPLLGLDQTTVYTIRFKRGGGDAGYHGTATELISSIKRPKWNASGAFQEFEVDHIVELQVSGAYPGNWGWAHGSDVFSEDGNVILLDASTNNQSGSLIDQYIRRSISRKHGSVTLAEGAGDTRYNDVEKIRTLNERAILERYNIYFKDFSKGGGNTGTRVKYWTWGQIQRGEHFQVFNRPRTGRNIEIIDINNPNPANPILSPHRGISEEISGSDQQVVIYGRNNALYRAILPVPAEKKPLTTQQSWNVGAARKDQIAGFSISEITFNPDVNATSKGQIGGYYFIRYGRGGRNRQYNLEGGAEQPRNFLSIDRIGTYQYAGAVNQSSFDAHRPELSVPDASPIQITNIGIEPEKGVVIQGKLLPTIPLIQQADIDVFVEGGELTIQKTFDIGEFTIPGPVDVTASSVTLGVSTAQGLFVNGSMDFEINRLGTGNIRGGARTGIPGGRQGGFQLGGEFNFDTELFDPARIEMWYADEAFGARGTIGIPSGRINGIRSAAFTIGYENDTITASGTAQFAAPGIQNAGLSLTYSEEEGLMIGGSLQLGEVPGLRSGSLEAEVQRRPDGGYKVSATGTAQPAIPGINSQVRLSYDDGIFDANVTAAYSRGMLSGELTLGATNRPVDPESNQPTGDPEPANVRAYGGGQVTVQLAPWLQGTVGITLLPNAEIELRGEIALPNTVDLFPRRSVEKNIFTINIDIPIVGVAVAGQRIGIFATIGGGVDVSAGFGPGQLRELSLGITYNPDHEDQTHVTGRGQLYVPADAGLRLFVRGGIGAGIPVVSATAGLEVSGELGLQGALEANVNVDWMPTRGLEIDANAGIFVEPRLRLSVDAYVDVSADLWLTTIELYNERWNLAAVEYGSNLRFGINFPIHYREGEPFDVSLDDVEFTVPDIDARSLITGVLDQF